MGAAGGGVAGDEGGGDFRVAAGGLVLAGQAGEELVEAELDLDADDGIVGAGHADVGLEGGALGEDAVVGGGDVGVGAEDGGDAAIEIPAEGLLFARGLGVEIDEDDLGGDFGEELVGFAEGVVAGGHEDAALEVEDGVLGAVIEGALVAAEAYGGGGVVAGTEQAAGALVRGGEDAHVVEDFALIPDVVAGGDDVGAEIEEFLGERGRDAEAAGRIFTVDDEEVDGVGSKQVGQVGLDDAAAGGAEDIADEENIHSWRLADLPIALDTD